MRAAECKQLYGEEATLEAGMAEVMHMIGRKAAIPEDYRLLPDSIINEALPSFLFYKVMEGIAETSGTRELAVNPAEREWKLVCSKRRRKKRRSSNRTKIKGRWVEGGHRR